MACTIIELHNLLFTSFWPTHTMQKVNTLTSLHSTVTVSLLSITGVKVDWLLLHSLRGLLMLLRDGVWPISNDSVCASRKVAVHLITLKKKQLCRPNGNHQCSRTEGSRSEILSFLIPFLRCPPATAAESEQSDCALVRPQDSP